MPEDNWLSRLGHFLGNIVRKSAAGKLEEKYSGRIPDNHVFKRSPTGQIVPAPVVGEFKPNQSYLQVMINHMYVSQARELWVEREHLGAVWMGFRYNGAMQVVPFMLGRDLLIEKVQQLPAGARIEFQDVRVGKVYPYTGDSLALYLGLWSAPMIDWATTIFSALDTIAGKVKIAGSLSLVLDMVEVLNQGISIVLGLNAIRSHLNLYQEFQDPTVGELGLLQPGYYVMIDAPNATFTPSNLQVVDGKLYSLPETGSQPSPFYAHDFLLYSISSPPQLSTAVDLFAKQYDTVLATLIGSKSDATKLAQAAQTYHTLQTQIVSCPDLTRADKNRLITYYGDSLNADAVRLAVNIKNSNVAFGPGALPQLPAGLHRPTQEEYEAQSTRLDPTILTANSAALAGAAAAQFAATLSTVTGT